MPDPRQPSEPTSPSEILDAGIPVDAADIDDVPAADDDAEPPGPRSEHAEAAPAPGGIRGALRRSWAGVRRVFAPLGRIPHPPLRSRRGVFLVAVVLVGAGAAISATAVTAIAWTETADFCGRCHTMGPELKAYEMSPHRELACAECHVEPGVAGWVKSKINGTRQLIMVMTGAFPKPIPAPDHADLPPTSDTCVRCHDPASLTAEGGPVKLVLQERFHEDESNSKDSVALVLRPAGFGDDSARSGVHWHIAEDVEYWSSDIRAQTIDLVGVNRTSGIQETFIASSQVTDSNDVAPDIARIKGAEKQHRMDCIDCHNRVGHGTPTAAATLDDSIAAQRIDRTLPFIKREAVTRLDADYDSVGDADRAFEGIRSFYQMRYPLVATEKAAAINTSIDEIKRVYRLVATPDMKVNSTTYPNNLGHQSSPGCFRCHDGAHYKVVDNVLTAETIPSACATCHTFPQIGSVASGVLIGERPATHEDRLWVFDHKLTAGSLDPSKVSCGQCHTKTYCDNCHDTKAINVPHDDMVFNHGEVMRNVGSQACAYCHQPAYCAQCHSDEVLPDPFPSSGGTSSVPAPARGPGS